MKRRKWLFFLFLVVVTGVLPLLPEVRRRAGIDCRSNRWWSILTVLASWSMKERSDSQRRVCAGFSSPGSPWEPARVDTGFRGLCGTGACRSHTEKNPLRKRGEFFRQNTGKSVQLLLADGEFVSGKIKGFIGTDLLVVTVLHGNSSIDQAYPLDRIAAYYFIDRANLEKEEIEIPAGSWCGYGAVTRMANTR